MTAYSLRAFEGWVLRNRRTWRSAFSFAVLGPLLSLLAMGFGVGSLVARREPAALAGVPYREFLAPGLLAAAAMQLAIGESTWPIMGALRWDRTYHAMLAAPLAVSHVLYGHLLWMATRITVASSAFLVVALVLGMPLSASTPLALPFAVLTGMAFAAPTSAWSITRKSEQSYAALYRVVVMPLFLFSATFFPLATLPSGLQFVVRLTPLWHGVSLCRGAMLGTLSPGGTAVHVLYLGTMLVAGVRAGRRTFAKALTT